MKGATSGVDNNPTFPPLPHPTNPPLEAPRSSLEIAQVGLDQQNLTVACLWGPFVLKMQGMCGQVPTTKYVTTGISAAVE